MQTSGADTTVPSRTTPKHLRTFAPSHRRSSPGPARGADSCTSHRPVLSHNIDTPNGRPSSPRHVGRRPSVTYDLRRRFRLRDRARAARGPRSDVGLRVLQDRRRPAPAERQPPEAREAAARARTRARPRAGREAPVRSFPLDFYKTELKIHFFPFFLPYLFKNTVDLLRTGRDRKHPSTFELKGSPPRWARRLLLYSREGAPCRSIVRTALRRSWWRRQLPFPVSGRCW